MDKYYNGLHSLRTTFTESFHGMGIDRQESGVLLLRKPGKMHWSYTDPPGKVFLLDGKYAWFYSPGDAQVERLAAAQLDDLRSPLRFLLGHTQLQKELEGLTLTTTDTGLQLSGVPKGMQKRVEKIVLGVKPMGLFTPWSSTKPTEPRLHLLLRIARQMHRPRIQILFSILHRAFRWSTACLRCRA